MIEHLQPSRAAYFYQRRKPISNEAIDGLFRRLRQTKGTAARDLFRVRRQAHEGLVYSAICFPYKRVPSFLAAASGAKETVYGYLLLIEKGEQVAVMKSGLDLPPAFKTAYLREVEDQQIERAVAHRDAVFQKVALRNTSLSKLVVSSKTLEARDLANAMSAVGASRFVAQRYSLFGPKGHLSATPSTGRIANRAEREDYLGTIAWAGTVMDALAAEDGETSDFIKAFARQLSLEQLPAGVRPSHLAFDVPFLTDQLFGDQVTLRLMEEGDQGFTELSKERVEAILADLDRGFEVQDAQGRRELVDSDSGAVVATLKQGKRRFTLSGLNLAAAANVFVEDVSLPPGEDENRQRLARLIDRNQLFTILFDDLTLAYLNGRLYKDEAILGGGERFLQRLKSCARLANATSEKGTFATTSQAFSATSVFRAVVDEVGKDDDVLICDDLGDEWADFIGLRTQDGLLSLSFYHAKHGTRSLSASAFHEAVGQGIKNLGRVDLPARELPRKLEGWSQAYRNDGVVTAIARLVRGGTSPEVAAKLELIRTAPEVAKRVYLVTSSLSRADVQAVFDVARQGTRPPAHFVQLYWLLTSFFTACSEMGTNGYVVCQP